MSLNKSFLRTAIVLSFGRNTGCYGEEPNSLEGKQVVCPRDTRVVRMKQHLHLPPSQTKSASMS